MFGQKTRKRVELLEEQLSIILKERAEEAHKEEIRADVAVYFPEEDTLAVLEARFWVLLKHLGLRIPLAKATPAKYFVQAIPDEEKSDE